MVPEIDYDNLAVQLLPTAQRLPYWKVFVRSLISQVIRLYNVFYWFMKGSVDVGYWNITTSYIVGNRVRTLYGVYECLADCFGIEVTDTTVWLKILDSFIGANERVRYNGGSMTMEYALNRIFGTTFRQPTSIDAGVGYLPLSDIYLTNTVPTYTSFVTYTTETLSSVTYTGGSGGTVVFTTGVFTGTTTYQFIIHIPIAVFNALGSDDAIRESIVRDFADKYILAGTSYIIQTY